MVFLVFFWQKNRN